MFSNDVSRGSIMFSQRVDLNNTRRLDFLRKQPDLSDALDPLQTATRLTIEDASGFSESVSVFHPLVITAENNYTHQLVFFFCLRCL